MLREIYATILVRYLALLTEVYPGSRLGRTGGMHMIGQRVGYVRVSTTDQHTDRQLDGVTVDCAFTDQASGKSTDRAQLDALKAYVREGDTVVVHGSIGPEPGRLAESRPRLDRSRDPGRVCEGTFDVYRGGRSHGHVAVKFDGSRGRI